MFELLKILIEKLANLIQPSVFVELRRRNELARIGRTLFSVYFRLSDLVESGHDLVKYLGMYVHRMEMDIRDSSPTKYAEEWGQRYIATRLATQRNDIQRLTEDILACSHELRLIDPQTVRQLQFLLQLKGGSLFYLTDILDQGILPLERPTYEEVHDKLRALELSPAEEYGYDREGTIFALGLRPKIDAASIGVTRPWDKSVFLKVQAYLETRKPRETLALLESVADQLRQSLLQHFSLQDVLLVEARSRAHHDRA